MRAIKKKRKRLPPEGVMNACSCASTAPYTFMEGCLMDGESKRYGCPRVSEYCTKEIY
jgi:hypothetical protein